MKQSLLRLKDFSYKLDTGIHIPKESDDDSTNFAYSDGVEAEEYVLKCIQEASDVSDNSPELARYARDWSSYYHLASGRANHIRVLDLPHDLSILELGSGCGAISRYLGENHRAVDCVEGSLRRAIIAKERCRDLDNVKVYCADFRKLEMEPEYDLVLLNGVLEYAPVFFGCEGRDADEATGALLRLAKSALKKNGVLLVAIENKIGLKYWCGATEDHTGGLFDGIHGYPNPGTAKTYSKNELTTILKSAGFGCCQFYSCFPDYKFPTSILANIESSSNDYYLHNWIPYPAENPGLSRKYLIHEGLAAKTLTDAGLIHEFANSFLVVASVEKPKNFERSLNPNWLASKVSVRNRNKAVHCITKLYPHTGTVEKRLINYVDKNLNTDNSLGHSAAPANLVGGNLLSWEVAYAVLSKNFQKKISEILAEYHVELLKKYSTGEADSEGFPLLRGEGFDFIMGNIIRTTSGLVGIDEEWMCHQTLTADYILYRSLNYDVLGLNKPWLADKIADPDEFIIVMIRKIYPSYDQRRLEKNRLLENNILLKVRGELGVTPEFSSHDRAVTWKKAIKTIAKQLPKGSRAKIVRVSEAINEKVHLLFADS